MSVGVLLKPFRIEELTNDNNTLSGLLNKYARESDPVEKKGRLACASTLHSNLFISNCRCGPSGKIIRSFFNDSLNILNSFEVLNTDILAIYRSKL